MVCLSPDDLDAVNDLAALNNDFQVITHNTTGLKQKTKPV